MSRKGEAIREEAHSYRLAFTLLLTSFVQQRIAFYYLSFLFLRSVLPLLIAFGSDATSKWQGESKSTNVLSPLQEGSHSRSICPRSRKEIRSIPEDPHTAYAFYRKAK